jgi:AcrR family transcriptional regulator
MARLKQPRTGTKQGGKSRNAAVRPPKVDLRVRKTREALGDALVSLMVEKPFDSIKVQDVLDRAGVGRSTFYVHYRDTHDLFMSDAEEFFEMIAMALPRRNAPSERVAPVSELFSHLTEMKKFHEAIFASGKLPDILELARGHFARGIELRLAQIPRGAAVPVAQRAAVAHAHAGALISLLQWWMAGGMARPPKEMDDLFHQMVWSGVSAK